MFELMIGLAHLRTKSFFDFLMAKLSLPLRPRMIKMRASSFQQVLLIYEGNLRMGKRLKETNSYVNDMAEYNDESI